MNGAEMFIRTLGVMTLFIFIANVATPQDCIDYSYYSDSSAPLPFWQENSPPATTVAFLQEEDRSPHWGVTPVVVCEGTGTDMSGAIPFSGGDNGYALWCGMLDQGDWENPNGYGNNWHDAVVIQTPECETATIDFWYSSYFEGTQWDYFVVEVVVDGTAREILRIDTESVFSGQQIHVEAFAADFGWRIEQIRLVFESDGAWSDEDGLFPSDIGAVWIDNLVVSADGEEVVNTDFETPGLPETISFEYLGWHRRFGLCANSTGLVIHDFIDPLVYANCNNHYQLPLEDVVEDVATRGMLAYVANGPSGLLVVNYVNIEAPVITSTDLAIGNMSCVTLVNEYCVVAGEGVKLFSLSNPGTPTLLAENPAVSNASDIAASGRYIYVADRSYGLRVFDIHSNPPLQQVYHSPLDNPGVIAQRGVYLYVSEYKFSTVYGLNIYEMSNPIVPTILTSVLFPAEPSAITTSVDYLYYGVGGGVQVIDVSNPAYPIVLGHVTTAGDCLGLASRDEFVWVADGDAGFVPIHRHCEDLTSISSSDLTLEINEDFVRVSWQLGNSYGGQDLKLLGSNLVNEQWEVQFEEYEPSCYAGNDHSPQAANSNRINYQLVICSENGDSTILAEESCSRSNDVT